MDKTTRSIPAREIARWCAYAIVLLAPGSFVVLPMIWVARHWATRAVRLSSSSHAGQPARVAGTDH